MLHCDVPVYSLPCSANEAKELISFCCSKLPQKMTQEQVIINTPPPALLLSLPSTPFTLPRTQTPPPKQGFIHLELTKLTCIVGGCKFVCVVNSWILLICITFMCRSKFARCLSIHHLPKHKRFILSKSQMTRV